MEISRERTEEGAEGLSLSSSRGGVGGCHSTQHLKEERRTLALLKKYERTSALQNSEGRESAGEERGNSAKENTSRGTRDSVENGESVETERMRIDWLEVDWSSSLAWPWKREGEKAQERRMTA